MESDSGDDDGDSVFSPKTLLRKMLESGSGDWEMIGCDGEARKFHQAVLTEQVSHFRALFSHQDTVESSTKRIVTPPEMEVSGQAVDAFLRFVYYRDTQAMESSFKICCALVRLGHYYTLPKLVEAVNGVIRKFGPRTFWFDLKDLWKLYQDVWLWEEGHPTKKKLMYNIIPILKRRFKVNADSELLVQVAGGDPVLKDLIVALVQ